MSITVRNWSKEDLERIRGGKDRGLITSFFNVKTFSEEEIEAYPYSLRKTYIADLAGQMEPIEFYATDDEMAKKFLETEYDLSIFPLLDLREKITTCREVNKEKMEIRYRSQRRMKTIQKEH